MIARTISFPKPKGSSAKVRRGPAAQIIQFPTQMAGDHLRARWAWLLDNHANWRTDDPDGIYEDREDWEKSARNLGPAYASLRGMEFGEASLRADVLEWQGIIRARHAVKSWLRDQGMQAEQVHSADIALTLLYRQCLAPEPRRA